VLGRLLCAAATPQEFSALFPGRPVPDEHCLLPLGPQAAACITGVGPVNAGIALGRLLALYRDIAGVVNVGLAGSFDMARAPIGACILGTEEIWPEYGLCSAGGVDAQGLGFAQWEQGGLRVVDRLPLCSDLAALGLPRPVDVVPGIFLTVAGVSADAERAGALAQRYQPLGENMEGFAAALACARQGIPCAELRIVSNKCGSRAEKDRDFPSALAKLGALGQNLFVAGAFSSGITL